LVFVMLQATFQHYMISIFSDMIKHCIEALMDDFSVFGFLFDDYLANMKNTLQ